MKYLDKVMFENGSHRPILFDRDSLSLFFQLGTAFFQDELKPEIGNIQKCPIVVPAFTSMETETFVDIKTPDALDFLCLENEKVTLFNLYRVMLNAAHGAFGKDVDFSWLYEQVKNVKITFERPETDTVPIYLTYGRHNSVFDQNVWYSDCIYSLQKSIENGEHFNSLFFWSHAADPAQMVIDFVRQAMAYADLYMNKDHVPNYLFIPTDSDIAPYIENFSTLFNEALVFKYCQNYDLYYLRSEGVIDAIKNLLEKKADDASDISFTIKELRPEVYSSILKGNRLELFLRCISRFRIGYLYHGKNFYIKEGRKSGVFNVIEVQDVEAFKQENHDLTQSPLRQYLLGVIDR